MPSLPSGAEHLCLHRRQGGCGGSAARRREPSQLHARGAAGGVVVVCVCVELDLAFDWLLMGSARLIDRATSFPLYSIRGIAGFPLLFAWVLDVKRMISSLLAHFTLFSSSFSH